MIESITWLHTVKWRENRSEKEISKCAYSYRHKHSPSACSRSRRILWAHQLCTCRTAWYQSPWSGGSWDGSAVRTRATGRGLWGRPWCTQRPALLVSSYKTEWRCCQDLGPFLRIYKTKKKIFLKVLAKLTWTIPSSPLHGSSSSHSARLLGNAAALPPSAGSCCNPWWPDTAMTSQKPWVYYLWHRITNTYFDYCVVSQDFVFSSINSLVNEKQSKTLIVLPKTSKEQNLTIRSLWWNWWKPI